MSVRMSDTKVMLTMRTIQVVMMVIVDNRHSVHDAAEANPRWWCRGGGGGGGLWQKETHKGRRLLLCCVQVLVSIGMFSSLSPPPPDSMLYQFTTRLKIARSVHLNASFSSHSYCVYFSPSHCLVLCLALETYPAVWSHSHDTHETMRAKEGERERLRQPGG